MSKPLRVTTRMDLVCRDLDIEADVTLDYHPEERPIIRVRREDCEPGLPAWVSIQSVEVVTKDPELPTFTEAELHQAAEKAAEYRMESIREVALRDGREPAAKAKAEAGLRILPMPAPRVAEIAEAPAHKPAAPAELAP